ncbi:MAG: ATP-dependent endonuclease [Candidatus Gastranaerophilales bacterium]|nr:ATP-dependent endonuclease [Candidatus Gastranaerophilales bacterium]
MELEYAKIKPLEMEDFIHYIDWLTRFKNPFFNINRVCDKIISKNLIAPAVSAKKTSELGLLDKFKIANYIWNTSCERLGIKRPKNSALKDFLIFEESKTFNTSLLVQDYNLPGKNFNALRKQLFFEIDGIINALSHQKNLPTYINRLVYLSKKLQKLSVQEVFNNYQSLYTSIKLVLLTEGITEEKLLPEFAQKIGSGFEKSGIKLIAAGGKSPLVKYYTQIRNLMKIPVFILLDADATDILDSLTSVLLKKDTLHIISDGEIEDILSPALIMRTINKNYSQIGQITKKDLQGDMPMCKKLKILYKNKGFGDFQKARFAQILKNNISRQSDISNEIKFILQKITKCVKC